MSGIRPLRSRVSSGHVVMVVAGLLGLLLSLSLLRRADDTVAVAVASRDLAAGTRLHADMLRTTRIHASGALLSRLIPDAHLGDVDGAILLAPIRRGDIVSRSSLAPASSGRATRAVSFPVDAALAVGGDIATGDHIDVLAAARTGNASGYVLVDAAVVGVHAATSGPLRAANDQLSITVTVDAVGAQRLVRALHAADLLVVRATGAPHVATVEWFDSGGSNG